MDKLKLIGSTVSLGGALFLTGCGGQSAGEVLEESIETIEESESYNEAVVNTVEAESDSIDITYNESVTFEPFARSRTDFNIGDQVEDMINLRYVDNVFYIQADDESWIPLEEEDLAEVDTMYSSMLINPRESDEDPFNIAVLKQMVEREEDIEMSEEDDQYILELTLSDEEEYSDELLQSLRNQSTFDAFLEAVNDDDEWSFTGLDMIAHIDKESKRLNYQEVSIVGEPNDMENTDEETTTVNYQITYSDYNEVPAIEVPENIFEFSFDDMFEEEDETNYVDLEEDGSEADGSSDSATVISSGGGTTEGAEDLFMSVPSMYQDSDYAGSMNEIEAQIPAINSLVPEGGAMMIWSSVAVTGEDKWDAWFVLVNRSGSDMKNIDTTFVFENEYGEALTDLVSMSFSEEEYGILENGSIVPFIVDIPAESQDAFNDVLTHVHAWPTVEDFDFEIVE